MDEKHFCQWDYEGEVDFVENPLICGQPAFVKIKNEWYCEHHADAAERNAMDQRDYRDRPAMSEQHFCQLPVDPATWDLYRDRRLCGAPAMHHSTAHQANGSATRTGNCFPPRPLTFIAEKSGLRN